MITPDTILQIYEVKGGGKVEIWNAPPSYIGIWNEDDFMYIFFISEEDAFVTELCDRNGLELVSRHEIMYKDWQQGLPQGGMLVAGLQFCSANEPCRSRDSILIDPSVVFGDGNHPTTIACLEIGSRIIRDGNITSVLDLGTGSGILALMAYKLGVPKITAVDKNKLAIQTALSNIEINGAQKAIDIREGEARWFLDIGYDLIFANLPFQVLLELGTQSSASQHGIWVISGINSVQADTLIELYSEINYVCTEKVNTDHWVTFVLKHKPR